MFQSYVKPLFSEAWDTFQLEMVRIGGNKRFFEFLREYGKEREPISKKYTSAAAVYYRKKLCFETKGIELKEQPPAKNATELAERTLENTQNWAKETDEKYQIQQKANDLAQKTKAGVASLWSQVAGKKKDDNQNPQ